MLGDLVGYECPFRAEVRIKKVDVYRCMLRWAQGRGFYKKTPPSNKQFYHEVEATLQLPVAVIMSNGYAMWKFKPTMIHEHLVSKKFAEDDTTKDDVSPLSMIRDLLEEMIATIVSARRYDSFMVLS